MASEKAVTLKEVLHLAQQLKLTDKVRLIQQIAPHIERELAVQQPKPRKSLRGLWRGLDITESDIAEMRSEMWGDFPRKDI